MADQEAAPLHEDQQKELDRANAEREQREQAALPYRWRQTLQDVTVTVPVPAGTRGKQLDVVLRKQHIKVGVKGQEPVIEGDMPYEIKGKQLDVVLRKQHIKV